MRCIIRGVTALKHNHTSIAPATAPICKYKRKQKSPTTDEVHRIPKQMKFTVSQQQMKVHHSKTDEFHGIPKSDEAHCIPKTDTVHFVLPELIVIKRYYLDGKPCSWFEIKSKSGLVDDEGFTLFKFPTELSLTRAQSTSTFLRELY
jgi:hypothetical protein